MWKSRSSAVSMVVCLVVAALGASGALAISQSGEQKDMRRVGHADLQGRPAYHPNFIVYPDGRVMAFVGTHSNTTDNGPRPNPLQPGQGIFVQRRLQHLAELTRVMVVAPFALIQYGNQNGARIRIGESRCPARRIDDGMTVLHPRWFYTPLSGSLTACWLFLRLAPMLMRLRREFSFDVIDTHFGHPEGVAGGLLSALLGVPFTMTLRGNEPKHSRSSLERFWMGWALRRAPFRRAA